MGALWRVLHEILYNYKKKPCLAEISVSYDRPLLLYSICKDASQLFLVQLMLAALEALKNRDPCLCCTLEFKPSIW